MLLAGAGAIEQRRAVAAGPLASLANSLADDLDRLLPDEDVRVHHVKARMTRTGGRCERDGAFLLFDPRSPSVHECPVCGTTYEGDEHYRWWIMGHHLWLAERSVHAAALWHLRGTPRYRSLADAILTGYAQVYPDLPDEDNVLGPSRVFFSTYLESIWLLQLALAVSLLEETGPSGVGDQVRDRVLGPSSALIASFDEGLSNRQVWNAAALGAAGVLLGRPALVDRALSGPAALDGFLRSAVLEDGTWYEGENYHLFAHRGLWHLMTLAGQVGALPSADLVRRFDLGFTAPLRTALPDFTFPSRRDSQYRASLRQWRIAESLELGRARMPGSPELAGGLTELYRGNAPGDAARWRSTAEAERNVPGVRLTRADLGWKSLVFAVPEQPSGDVAVPGSALMAGQGFAVIRRDLGRTYTALDYGHTGGSHGHPDRLNLWLVLGDRRVFEDVGTGSYVERALHWYRSTLAHNAPLVDGRSQVPTAGSLRAWDERDGFTWVDAEATITPGVLVRRSVVVGPGHLVDRVAWKASRAVMFDLPLHLDGDIVGARWRAEALTGDSGLEDGFPFVSNSQTSDGGSSPAQVNAADIHGVVHVSTAHAWWRAVAPGPPGSGDRRFLLIRARGERGCITSSWSWTGAVTMRGPEGDVFDLTIDDSTFTHGAGSTWHVTHDAVAVILDGRREPAPGAVAQPDVPRRSVLELAVTDSVGAVPGDLIAAKQGVRFELGREQYRRTEATWEEAGSPTAVVVLAATRDNLVIEVTVASSDANFVAARDDNPLDNEHPDVNSDGVQIHLTASGTGTRALTASWLIVPEPGSPRPRVSGRDDAGAIPLDVTWRRTTRDWQVLARIPRAALGATDADVALGVIVNEMPRGRERRRGQLVLGDRGPGWAYLRGDRQDRGALIPIVVRDG
jgi:hypothetical protein